VRLLQAQAERQEDGFFARRGLGGARDFRRLYARLSGALLLRAARPPDGGGAAGGPPGGPALWVNKEARHPLPAEVQTSLRHALQAAED
jgi:hypothetical protein